MVTIIPPITIYKGESRPINITVDTTLLVPDDITNDSFVWVLWHSLLGDVLTKTVGDGLTIADQSISKGLLQVAIAPGDTAALQALCYTQELKMCTGDAQLVMAQGYLIVEPSRTNKQGDT